MDSVCKALLLSNDNLFMEKRKKGEKNPLYGQKRKGKQKGKHKSWLGKVVNTCNPSYVGD